MSDIPKVVVVGGGIIGTAIAYYLAARGYRPVLLERKNIAGGTSSACEGTVIMQSKAPGPKLEMALQSRALYASLSETLGYDVEYEERGGLVVIENEQQAAIMLNTIEKQRSFGLKVDLLNIKETRELEPLLSENLWGAAYSEADGQVNPILVARAYSRAAARLGAGIRVGVNVTSLLVESGQVRGVMTSEGPVYADCVVNAAGVWASALTAPHGYEPSLVPRRGQILVSEPLPPLINHIVLCACYLAAKHHPELLDRNNRHHRLGVGTVIEQTAAGQLLIGSTREFAGFNDETTLEGIKSVAEHAVKLFPRLGKVNIIRTFSGLRPKTADGMPVIGPVESLPGLIMATGHEGDGIALAPITGTLIADLVEKMI
ncbi:Glycine oxidase [Syntrophobotulus glycolicus DSM 8271]|uniref:Glycine oxidase n=1 Tax=Syntrophobotulus glycolicus (strain DSM 8271 / FlGlyR) TaxID=645991 RepID=F0SU51_SYNGF|nr:FAD-binding oxidoreductase [Syntrophobotulus glycolicus]ADY55434.1 Glycine oxidase [Syntrophobotulus glycolicus DSM 8271]